MSGARHYGGMSGADRVADRRRRFIAAGLELMGTKGIPATTLRGVAEQAGLAARYFAESFPTIEDLHIAVFDEIVAELEERGLAAIADTDGGPRARSRAALGALADLLLTDARKGRVVLIESGSSPVLGPRRLAEAQRFAGIVAGLNESGSELRPLDLQLAAQFVIGGVGETLTAVLVGAITVDRDDLIDMLNDLLFAALRGVRTTAGAVRTG
ncbi:MULTISPECIES: TetR/AcrR family transcriptional regulator [Mycobacteriaceae]|nr:MULTISPECIES: TetR/AcrR family transcriptional regulator [Mycobacteriaceae]KAB7757116.1 TetR family transcriptional regulator [Mycolicibacterium mucogenicum DSM 44124]GCA99333.1 TetR family transcriptional regulator [Mycolicibacterium sp. NCC-Tsukiji]